MHSLYSLHAVDCCARSSRTCQLGFDLCKVPTSPAASASKLTFPPAEQGKGEEEPDMESHPSASVWKQWSSTD